MLRKSFTKYLADATGILPSKVTLGKPLVR